jgi:DNA mismatch repair protein MutH
MELPFDPKDKNSVIAFAKQLKDKTLREACREYVSQHGYSGKGTFGQILEKFYFHYEPNSEAGPDFPEAGIELKSSPLKQLQNEEFRSKERLVLNIINYVQVADQDFHTSTFWKKNKHLLLIFYLHKAGIDVLDFAIKLVDDWTFPIADLEIIKKDWESIRKKIREGKAHELSEGDTYYLGACTKGGKGGNFREQPNSKKLAKQRAYSLKQGYVNHIIASIAGQESGIYGKLISSAEIAKKQTIEEIALSKFEPYYNQSTEAIMAAIGVEMNTKAKSFLANLVKLMLGIGVEQEIEEFEKAEIIVKTVRLQANDLPKESISFPHFKYNELVKEKWDDSSLKNILEHKFLFVFFQYEGEKLFLRKAKFWNMPQGDIREAKKVWNKTRAIVARGEIVKEVKNGIRYTNFPGKSFSRVAHARPHAANADDVLPLPAQDKVTGVNEYTKHCFWLNNSYVKDEIYLK